MITHPKRKASSLNVSAVAQQYSSATFFLLSLINSSKSLSKFSNFFFLFKNLVVLKLLNLKLLSQGMPVVFFFVIWRSGKFQTFH